MSEYFSGSFRVKPIIDIEIIHFSVAVYQFKLRFCQINFPLAAITGVIIAKPYLVPDELTTYWNA